MLGTSNFFGSWTINIYIYVNFLFKSTIHPFPIPPSNRSQEMFPMPDPMPRELPKTLPALDPLAKKQNLAKVDQWPGRTRDGDGIE